MNFIPYAKQSISKSDIKAVEEVLKSDFLTQGPIVERFENKVSEKVASKYAVAVNSATSALHISCKALGLKNEEWLWTSPNSFVASANCAMYCGANIDFIDIDKRSYNISINKLKDKLIHAKKNNKLPKIIIPVHYAGQSCDMKEIKALSDEFNFKIIEDASHAIGGKYLGENIGCNKFSDITIFSFHPVKIITTGEGGLALTNDAIIRDKLKSLRSHGISRNNSALKAFPENEIWNYNQDSLGFNYRIPDINCALGISQLNNLDSFIKKRTEIAEIYNNAFKDTSLVTPWQNPLAESSYHLYPIRVNEEKVGIQRNFLYHKLKKLNIGVNIHYIPIYRHSFYQNLGFKKGYCIEAENFFQEVISLPMFPTLSEKNLDFVIENIKKIIKK